MKHFLVLITILISLFTNSNALFAVETDYGPCKFSKEMRATLERMGVEIETVKEAYSTSVGYLNSFRYALPGDSQKIILVLDSGKILISLNKHHCCPIPMGGSEICSISSCDGFVCASDFEKDDEHNWTRSFVLIANIDQPEIIRSLIEIRNKEEYVFNDGFTLREQELFDITRLHCNGSSVSQRGKIWPSKAAMTDTPNSELTIFTYLVDSAETELDRMPVFTFPGIIDQKQILKSLNVGDQVVFRAITPCKNDFITDTVCLIDKVKSQEIEKFQELTDFFQSRLIKAKAAALEMLTAEFKTKYIKNFIKAFADQPEFDDCIIPEKVVEEYLSFNSDFASSHLLFNSCYFIGELLYEGDYFKDAQDILEPLWERRDEILNFMIYNKNEDGKECFINEIYFSDIPKMLSAIHARLGRHD